MKIDRHKPVKDITQRFITAIGMARKHGISRCEGLIEASEEMGQTDAIVFYDKHYFPVLLAEIDEELEDVLLEFVQEYVDSKECDYWTGKGGECKVDINFDTVETMVDIVTHRDGGEGLLFENEVYEPLKHLAVTTSLSTPQPRKASRPDAEYQT